MFCNGFWNRILKGGVAISIALPLFLSIAVSLGLIQDLPLPDLTFKGTVNKTLGSLGLCVVAHAHHPWRHHTIIRVLTDTQVIFTP
jgi:hypothetical protein